MTPNFIIQQAADIYQQLHTQLQNASKEGAPEFIHAFRVEVKSFNGIVHYLKEVLKPSDDLLNQLMLDLKPYYKSSGKVRNITVIQELLFQHKMNLSDDDFSSHLSELLRFRLSNFKEISSVINLPAAIDLADELKMLQGMTADFDALFDTHLQKNKQKAVELITSNLPGEPWHEARAFFKRNYLLLKLVSDEIVDLDEMTESRALEQELGSWHDLIMLEKAYSKFLVAQKDVLPLNLTFQKKVEELKSIHITKIKEIL